MPPPLPVPPAFVKGRPFRWHRLLHATLGSQMMAHTSLAVVTQWKWHLAQKGIPTKIVSEWLSLD